MPNWCENTLKIYGDPKELKKFKLLAKSKGTALSLNKFIRLPTELKDTQAPNNQPEKERKKLIKKYETDNWYDWQVANWGTKWDIEATLEEEDDEYLSYSFPSAWGPPSNWIKKVGKIFPTLTFSMKYEEEGMGFLGVSKSDKGKFTDKCINL